MKQGIRFNLPFLLAALLFFSCGKKLSEAEFRQQARELEKQEKYEDALKTYLELLEAYPTARSADTTIQQIAFLYYNNLHDFEQAVKYHARLIKEFPDSKFAPQARFMVGYIYANNLKDYDMAREAYTEFLERHPDSELAESVRWELEHLGQDVNSQLNELFGQEQSNGTSR